MWNRDLSGDDPEGPLPEFDPDLSDHTISKERASVRMARDPLATAREWQDKAEAKNLAIRDLVIDVHRAARTSSARRRTMADHDQPPRAGRRQRRLHPRPHITPAGLDAFADKVVPLLQERGVFRTDYEGTTLRDHLGIGAGVRGQSMQPSGRR